MKLLSASLVILGLAVRLLAPSPTAAQSESPEAREIVGLTLALGAFDALVAHAAQIGTSRAKVHLEGRLGRQFSEDESRRLTEVLIRIIKETLPRSDYEAVLVDLLVRYYSPQELKDLVAFYRTPLGTKVLRFSSAGTEETNAAIQRMMAARQRELLERLAAEFVREFPDLNRELERQQRR
jgi:hypothetical protein